MNKEKIFQPIDYSSSDKVIEGVDKLNEALRELQYTMAIFQERLGAYIINNETNRCNCGNAKHGESDYCKECI